MGTFLQKFGYYKSRELPGMVMYGQQNMVRDGKSIHITNRDRDYERNPLEIGDYACQAIEHRARLLKVLKPENRFGLVKVEGTSFRLKFNDVFLEVIRRKNSGEMDCREPDPNDAKIFIEEVA